MTSDAAFSRLFDECPIWLWPVLIWSLRGLGEEIARLEASGDTWYALRLTRWGRAYIARAPTRRLPTWKDQLFQTVMGAPIPAALPERPKLGIATAENQVDWAWHEFGPDRRGAAWIPHHDRTTSRIRRSRSPGRLPAALGTFRKRSQSFGHANAGMTLLCCCGVRAPP